MRAKSKLYFAAEQSYRKALELNPKVGSGVDGSWLVYELEGKTEDAIQTYQRLLQVGPQNVWARRRLANSMSAKTNSMKRYAQFEDWKAAEPIRAKPASRSA